MHWFPAYVGLGSNLDEPAVRVHEALVALHGLPDSQLVAISPLYGSRPLGPIAQADYCNAAAGLLTGLTAMELLRALQALERKLGRARDTVRWGPRRIDLDLLVFGGQRLSTDDLTLPHPGIMQRNFVLYPLWNVAPDLEIAGLGRVARLVRNINSDGLWRLDGKAILVNA